MECATPAQLGSLIIYMLPSGFQFSTECATPAQLGSLIIYMLPSGFQFSMECATPAQLGSLIIYICYPVVFNSVWSALLLLNWGR